MSGRANPLWPLPFSCFLFFYIFLFLWLIIFTYSVVSERGSPSVSLRAFFRCWYFASVFSVSLVDFIRYFWVSVRVGPFCESWLSLYLFLFLFLSVFLFHFISSFNLFCGECEKQPIVSPSFLYICICFYFSLSLWLISSVRIVPLVNLAFLCVCWYLWLFCGECERQQVFTSLGFLYIFVFVCACLCSSAWLYNIFRLFCDGFYEFYL